MLVPVGALLVSFIFPFAIFFFLRGAHKDDAEYKKDCIKLLLKGLLLGFRSDHGLYPGKRNQEKRKNVYHAGCPYSDHYSRNL